MGTTRANAILVAAAALLIAAAAAQTPAAAPGPDTSTTAPGAPGPSTVAGGPGPSAGLDCGTYLFNMSDCLTYVEEGSNLSAPDKACCPELAGLVESQPICLCQLVGTNISASFGVQINLQKALTLPSVCAVDTPPISTCSAFGYPVGGPMPSEAPSPTGGTSPGGTSPEAGTPGSGASGIATISQLLGFAIACLTTALVF